MDDASRKMWEVSHGHQLTGAMRAAVEIGAFEALDGREATATELATATRSSERGIRVLCDALTALGILEKTQGRYRFLPEMAPVLSPSSPTYKGDIILLAAYPALFEAWARASEAVRQGGSVLPENGLTPNHDFWIAYARRTHQLSYTVGRALNQALSGRICPARILDVGCGSGMAALPLLEGIAPTAELVQVDWANVLQVARGQIEQRLPPGARLRQLEGDALTIDLGDSYDLAIVSQFLQMFDPSTCVRFLARVRAAMRPGGVLAIGETPPDDERQKNSYSLLFAMTMLLWTPAGDMYTFAQLAAMLHDAGFVQAERIDVAQTPRCWVLGIAP
jgi:ubiquinone/menaquinone biosynthesis C-methylase UbiE